MEKEAISVPLFASIFSLRILIVFLSPLPPIVTKATAFLPAKFVFAIKALIAGTGLNAQTGVPINIKS